MPSRLNTAAYRTVSHGRLRLIVLRRLLDYIDHRVRAQVIALSPTYITDKVRLCVRGHSYLSVSVKPLKLCN